MPMRSIYWGLYLSKSGNTIQNPVARALKGCQFFHYGNGNSGLYFPSRIRSFRNISSSPRSAAAQEGACLYKGFKLSRLESRLAHGLPGLLASEKYRIHLQECCSMAILASKGPCIPCGTRRSCCKTASGKLETTRGWPCSQTSGSYTALLYCMAAAVWNHDYRAQKHSHTSVLLLLGVHQRFFIRALQGLQDCLRHSTLGESVDPRPRQWV